MDQRRDRGGAFHGVTEPGLQWHLRALGAGAQQQHQADGVEGVAAHLRCGGEHRAEVQRPDRGEHDHDRDRQADVADPVDDEGLLGCCSRAGFVGPESDQQIGRQTDALPTEVEDKKVIGHHQQQHGGDEQVEIAEESAAVRIVGHVAD